jgi:signal transduction histidine kinase
LPDSKQDLAAWRRRALDFVLWVVVPVRTVQLLHLLLGPPVPIPRFMLVVGLGCYACLVAIMLFRRLPHLLRGSVLTVLAYGASYTAFSVSHRVEGSALLGLVVIPVNVAVLIGRRSAWFAAGVSGASLLVLVLIKDYSMHHPEGWFGPLLPMPYSPYQSLIIGLAFLPMLLLQDRFTALFQRLLANEKAMRIRLQAESAERRYLEGALLEASERERQSVGHELHDGVCQEIASAMIQCKLLQESLAAGGPPQMERFLTIEAMLDGSLGQMHDLARGLSPETLTPGALVPSLRDLARRTRETFEVECQLEAGAVPGGLAPTAATHLYRIAQEAIVNAVKHGKPQRILLGLQSGGGRLTLEVSNDGRSFAAPRDYEGMGLRIMRYRSQLLGGTLELLPVHPSGLRLRCSVPQAEEA